MPKTLNTKIPATTFSFLMGDKMDERITQIEEIAKQLFRCFGGVGGQSIPLQEHNRVKSELGKNIIKLIKDYKEWYKSTYE